MCARSFSTLYRVDAIEAHRPTPTAHTPGRGFSTLYRVDAIEAPGGVNDAGKIECFSTLYRVDAIEADVGLEEPAGEAGFQYPLSGRCY